MLLLYLYATHITSGGWLFVLLCILRLYNVRRVNVFLFEKKNNFSGIQRNAEKKLPSSYLILTYLYYMEESLNSWLEILLERIYMLIKTSKTKSCHFYTTRQSNSTKCNRPATICICHLIFTVYIQVLYIMKLIDFSCLTLIIRNFRFCLFGFRIKPFSLNKHGQENDNVQNIILHA